LQVQVLPDAPFTQLIILTIKPDARALTTSSRA
jgi:hypothetical protein